MSIRIDDDEEARENCCPYS